MADYILSCCSTADLTREHFESRDISYICFHFRLGDTEYFDDLGESVPFDDFYAAMAAGTDTATAQVNVGEYLEYFEKFLKEGKDIVHITLSSGLSGTINSARNAAYIAMQRHPERTIYVVDSLGASSGYGLFMDKLADLRDEGLGAQELVAWAEENRLRMNHLFFSTDLSYYVKGGRISKAAAVFGGILNICPLLDMDGAGHLVPHKKLRGKKKVELEMVADMERLAENGTDYSGKCYISQSGCYADARDVADMVEARFPKLNGRVEINYVGTTIGSHTGPGTVALFFWGKDRGENKE